MTRTLLLLAVVAWAAPPAQAQRKDLKYAAVEIAKAVRETPALGKSGVRVGAFTAPGLGRGHGGPALAKELREALKGSLSETADVEVSGTIEYADAGDDGKVVNIEATLRDTRTQRSLKTAGGQILYVHDIARMVGVCGTIPSGIGSREARKELAQLSARPAAVVADGVVSTGKDSPYRVEIRVKGRDGAAPVELKDGLPFVTLGAGDEFEVVVRNQADHEVAARVMIDGIDQFAFSDDRTPDGDPKYTHTILGDKSTAAVRGWHLRSRAGGHDLRPFAPADPDRDSRVGMITVSFSRAVAKNSRSATATVKGLTGAGADESLEVDPPTEFVTIRFDRTTK